MVWKTLLKPLQIDLICSRANVGITGQDQTTSPKAWYGKGQGGRFPASKTPQVEMCVRVCVLLSSTPQQVTVYPSPLWL
jgi:hypothetical protein